MLSEAVGTLTWDRLQARTSRGKENACPRGAEQELADPGLSAGSCGGWEGPSELLHLPEGASFLPCPVAHGGGASAEVCGPTWLLVPGSSPADRTREGGWRCPANCFRRKRVGVMCQYKRQSPGWSLVA